MMSSCCGAKEDPEQAEKKSNRPREQAFYQQRLPAWQPLLTARSVYPLFFIIGLAFVPLGAYMYTVSQGVFELVLPYTHCSNGLKNCSEVLRQPLTRPEYRKCNCTAKFELKETVKGQVYMYYALTNFYQNHRRYVKSRDDAQLNGQPVMAPSGDCTPYQYWKGNKSVPFAPCGAIANSIFNDSFTLFFDSGTSALTEVGLIKSGIAWPTDVKAKFGKPPTDYLATKTHKPINWEKTPLQRSTESFKGDEDLIVWMRTAALPKFRKLYRRINHTVTNFKEGLPKGNYTINIVYAYPVTSFGGTKSIILSTTSWLGGKNDMIGISYMVVGCIHIVLAIAFVVIDVKTKKRHASFDLEEPIACVEKCSSENTETSSMNVQHDERV